MDVAVGRLRTLIPSLSKASPLLAGYWAADRNGPLSAHAHEGREFGIVLSGSHERLVGGSLVRLDPGDVWFCAKWEPHAWRFQRGSVTLSIHFLPRLLGDEQAGGLPWLDLFLAPADRRPSASTPRLRAAMLDAGRRIHTENVERKPHWLEAIRLTLLLALLTLRREWKPPPASMSAASRDDLRCILPALLLVRTTPSHLVSLKEAAAACSMGRTTFWKHFRDYTGMTFAAFELQLGLDLAEAFLEFGRHIDVQYFCVRTVARACAST